MGLLCFWGLTFLKVHHKDEKGTENVYLHHQESEDRCAPSLGPALGSLGMDEPEAPDPGGQPSRTVTFQKILDLDIRGNSKAGRIRNK